MKKAFFSLTVLLCFALSLRADVYTPFLTEEQYLQLIWDTIVDRYDVEGLDEATFRRAVQTVFSEPQVDDTCETLPEGDWHVSAV